MAKKPEAQEPESVGVSVRLPATLLSELDQIANEERRTRGNVIRIALEEWLMLRAKK
jgi:metal-responsive CopG/Arc/MetJ family transcriptional regulator